MKKLSVILLAIGLVFGIASASVASEGGSWAPEICKKFQDKNPELFDKYFDNIGDCVSGANALFNRNNYNVGFCKYITTCDPCSDKFQIGQKQFGL